jgi:dTMP kinase
MGFYGARCDHTQSLIIPSLENGSHVLSERYYASSFAYQKQTQTELEAVHAISKPYLLEPDLVLFLDISPETSVKRMAEERVAKGIALDKFELRGLEFMQSVRANYLRISRNETPATHKRWCTIDAEQPIEKVHQDIFKILSEVLQLPA